MLDLLFDLGSDLIDWVGDFVDGGDAVGGAAVGTELLSNAFEDVSTALLIQGVIYVTSLTVDSIRSELSNRRELKGKGVKHVEVLKEFIDQSGYTVVSLAALNAQNQQVGTVNMRSKGYTDVHKGQRIAI